MKIFSMFDGVGGFIVGLENSSNEVFQTLYSNQYEPSRKTQDAYEVGLYRFPDMEHIPTDVALIPNEKFKEMKANGVDMIVGGFPCQDYSVARSKKNELGIEGKKGVLFWEIIRATEVIKPKYLMLENVDRLLKAPSNQRGRDFAIMLAAFNQLGYSVEWRVINAADYGRAQRRRRVFFFVFRNDTKWGKRLYKKYDATLSKNAEQSAVTQANKTINLNGSPLTNCATLIANHWNTPVSDIRRTIIIIPTSKNKTSSLLYIVSRTCSWFIIPIKVICNDVEIAEQIISLP